MDTTANDNYEMNSTNWAAYNGQGIILTCRFCGKSEVVASSIPGICIDCFPTMVDEILKKIIPKTSSYCQDCFSHHNACKCDKKKAIDKLKK